MIRLIVSDLDGTLLLDHETISDANLCAIHRIMADGIAFAVASGRSAESCGRLLLRYGLDVPIIAVNGGHVVDKPNGTTISLHTMDRTIADECMRIFETHGLFGCLYTEQWIVYSSLDALLFFEAFNQSDKKRKRIDSIRYGKRAVAEALRTKPLKVFCAFQEGQEVAFQTARNVCAALPGVALTSSWVDNFEVMPAGVDKATALHSLCMRFGITREEVMAFGDNDNDISMLQWAGIGVAMDNAREDVKLVSDYVTKSCFDSGVAHAIDRFLS